MYNQDVLDLYPRVNVGAKVTVTYQSFANVAGGGPLISGSSSSSSSGGSFFDDLFGASSSSSPPPEKPRRKVSRAKSASNTKVTTPQ